MQLEVIRSRFALVQRTLEMECAQEKFRYLVEHPNHSARHAASEEGALTATISER